jgi:hypothetical protein
MQRAVNCGLELLVDGFKVLVVQTIKVQHVSTVCSRRSVRGTSTRILINRVNLHLVITAATSWPERVASNA